MLRISIRDLSEGMWLKLIVFTVPDSFCAE